MPTPPLGAIILAGGRARRVDGEAKPLFEVGGRSLLSRAVDAASGAATIAVVAPELDPQLAVEWLREEPPFSGPAAAAVTALRVWAERGFAPEWTLVLAADLARADAAVALLNEGAVLARAEVDGLCLADAASRPQWLLGLYRTAALARVAATLPEGARDLPFRALVEGLAIDVIATTDDIVADVDTWEDLARVRAAFEEES